jgi:hypothetical protein
MERINTIDLQWSLTGLEGHLVQAEASADI